MGGATVPQRNLGWWGWRSSRLKYSGVCKGGTRGSGPTPPEPQKRKEKKSRGKRKKEKIGKERNRTIFSSKESLVQTFYHFTTTEFDKKWVLRAKIFEIFRGRPPGHPSPRGVIPYSPDFPGRGEQALWSPPEPNPAYATVWKSISLNV